MTKVKYSFAQWCRDNGHEDWLGLWDYEKNDIEPDEVTYGTKNKFWFKCQNETHLSYLCSITDFRRGYRCPICSSHKIVAGINDVATINPEYVKYFVNPLDAEKISISSHKIIEFKCPNCGYKHKGNLFNEIKRHFSCPVCDDGMSWCSKFVLCVLNQLKNKNNFEVYPEHVFNWSRKDKIHGTKRYDFLCVQNNEIIIEVHGKQHYNGGFETFGGKNLEEEQANDIFKYNLAIHNGIKKENYVIIDARESSVDWIKSSIMNSSMPILFNFTEEDINWQECVKTASKSLVIECCDFWNEGLRSTVLIGNKLGISEMSVIRYLKRSSSANMCDYSYSDLSILSRRKPILCADNNFIFDCAQTCSDLSESLFKVFISEQSITMSASGRRNSTHGYHFQYITKEEFLHAKRYGQSHTFGEVYFYNADDPKGQNLIL